MDHTFVESRALADPALRSVVYKLLCLGFTYPRPDIFTSLQSGAYLSGLRNAMSFLPHLKRVWNGHELTAGDIEQYLKRTTCEELQESYTRAFDAGAPEPLCPPYEGLYREGIERTVILIEVSEFYRQFGLRISSEEETRELPDHLCAELEFLHFLTFKEGQARQEANQDLLKGYIWAQKDFLDLHLATWVPIFSNKLQASSPAPLYAALADITAKIVTSEREVVRSMFQEFGEELNVCRTGELL